MKWGGCPAALDHKLKPIAKIPATAPRTKHIAKKGKIKRKGLQLFFPDEVEFTPSSATLHASAAPVLKELQIFLLANKDVNQVRIEGHVDAPVNTPDMVALSKARSMAVAGWLANNGVEPGRLLPVGCGANRPIKNAKGQRRSLEDQAHRGVRDQGEGRGARRRTPSPPTAWLPELVG